MPTFVPIAVVAAKPAGQGSLWLRFSDGAEGSVDLAAHIVPGFGEISDDAYLARAEVVGGALRWPNGYDCDPEWLRSVTAISGADPRANDDGWDGLRQNARGVPEISRFFGIVIRMLFNDHSPPHFHAQYGDHEISLQIDGDGMSGSFPPSWLPLIFEWRDRHRHELMANWDRLRRGEPARPVAPLD